jgi:hypothetical protein
MDQHAIERIRDAVETARQQLSSAHPSPSALTLYLNSIARSLIGTPAARDAVERIDAALRGASLPATWEQ